MISKYALNYQQRQGAHRVHAEEYERFFLVFPVSHLIDDVVACLHKDGYCDEGDDATNDDAHCPTSTQICDKPIVNWVQAGRFDI